MTDRERPWATPRSLAVATGLGLVAGVALVLVLRLLGDPVPRASEIAFALGALGFGFGLTAWAATAWLGGPLGTYLEATAGAGDWSTTAAAAAFSRLAALGLGAMVGASVMQGLH